MKMAYPSGPVLGAYLEFLYRVTILARALAWNRAPSEQIAALMSAVHNLPLLMTSWESFDPALFRRYLEGYDEQWGARSEWRLVASLDECLKRRGV